MTKPSPSRRRRILAALLLVVLAALALLQFSPLPASLQRSDYAVLMLDRNGRPLAARIAADQQWRFAPVETLPDKYREALLTFEDRRFRWHPGVDPLALARATVANIRAGRVVSGGSTLTMQLARLLRDDPPRTLWEKAREALLALQLEWRLGKSRILVEYASRAPFGGNTVGLRAAAWRYFQRAPDDLSWAEAALLAVLPNSPALIHPGRQRQQLLAKRDRLLEALRQRGLIDADALRLAKLEPLPRTARLPSLAPHLLDTLAADTTSPLIHTTLDAGLQQRVNALTGQHGRRLANDGVHNLSVVVIDHRDLAVRAYVGNVTHGDRREYGAAVDIAGRPRSTGSVLKPLLYGLMLQEGLLLPDTLVPDLPTNYGGYSPENFDREYRGAVPAHEALAQSLNIPAVRMLRQYGVARFHDQLRAMGMSTLFRDAENYGLTLVLGGAEGKLMELTALYARLMASARDGQAAPVTVLSDVQPLPEPFPIGAGAAWLTLEALRDVARPGTARQWRLYRSSQAIAWKTGTSYGLRDAWAIGSNGRYTVGVWAGNGNGEPAPVLGGATTAAPLMLDLFSLLGPAEWPQAPLGDLKELRVCRDDGYLAGGQCSARTVLAPLDSHFQAVTPHHLRVHVDDQGRRVHSGCENVAAMSARDWFVLPPAQSYFYRFRHPEYRPLPAWREDCAAGARALSSRAPMAVIYPHAGSALYLPVELGGQRGGAVFRVVHERDDAELFWHLDDRYLGRTAHFHEWAIQAAPGWHTLTLVDDQGFRLRRRFQVLSH